MADFNQHSFNQTQNELEQYNEKMKIIYSVLKFEELIHVAINELNKLNNQNNINNINNNITKEENYLEPPRKKRRT